MTEKVRFQLSNEIAVLTIDDGKANALSHEVIKTLNTGLDQATEHAKAVVIAGRPGMLSAGFDLGVMKSGPEAMQGLVTAGADFLLRLYTFPKPVVVACTGHAMAAGALLLLSADWRIGVEGEFKIGLPEVSIGMPLPIFGVELARTRLATPFLERATAQAEVFDPKTAVQVGFLDRLTAASTIIDDAVAKAGRLAKLGGLAFEKTRETLRGASVRHIRETLNADIAGTTLG
ncbi:MAG: crotonase/enoyl-CoA hydratase family protein [Acidobacteria bacterium]|nr:MAG: crotonase/enoyl-CoA hydratase family protein [Acidobacteriota bacterium]